MQSNRNAWDRNVFGRMNSTLHHKIVPLLDSDHNAHRIKPEPGVFQRGFKLT